MLNACSRQDVVIMKITKTGTVRRGCTKIFVDLIRLTSRPDFVEIVQFAHTIYDLVALHIKWLPELPPMP